MSNDSAAGSVGHSVIKRETDIDEVPDNAFPCMVESHLSGQGFSCEVFVHDGKISFLNINEYIHLGYSQNLPPTPSLEKYRPKIRAAIEHLIKAYGARYGILHPEYFLDQEGELNFAEVPPESPAVISSIS